MLPCRCCGFGCAAALCLAALAAAQDAPRAEARPYNGIQAGLDAFRLAEEQRQLNVAGQVGLNEQLRYWPAWTGFGGAAIYYSTVAPYLAAQAPPARQSIGQWQGQTGPNRWESHPMYAPPLTPYQPLPLVASPWLNHTPYATVPVLAPPPAVAAPPGPPETVFQPPPAPEPPRRGPREY